MTLDYPSITGGHTPAVGREAARRPRQCHTCGSVVALIPDLIEIGVAMFGAGRELGGYPPAGFS
jgi:hypothetical protein